MRHPLCIFLLLAIPLLSGCQSNHVAVDYDTKMDFADWHYYRWAEQDNHNNPYSDPLLNERTKSAIELQLLKASLTRALEKRPPDVLVRYFVSSEIRNEESKSRGAIGFGGGNHGSSLGISLSIPLGKSTVVKDAQIIIHLLESTNKELKWRGSKQFEIRDETPAEITSMINLIVADIFNHYPPSATKP
jgi:hypothetical protein